MLLGIRSHELPVGSADERVRTEQKGPIEIGTVRAGGTEPERPSVVIPDFNMKLVTLAEELRDEVGGEVRFERGVTPRVIRTEAVASTDRKCIPLAFDTACP
jgi:hypothetical protein